jgi:hypothetical protein
LIRPFRPRGSGPFVPFDPVLGADVERSSSDLSGPILGPGLVVTRVEQRVTTLWLDEFGETGRSRALAFRNAAIRRPPAWRRDPALIGIGAGLAIGAAALAALVGYLQPGRPASVPARMQEVRVVLPPASAGRSEREPVRQARAEAASSPKRLAAVGSAPSAAPAQAADPPPAAPGPTAASADPVQDRSIAAASARALSTGSVETWREDGQDGFVAAGPELVEEDQVCREVTIWRRGGEQGEAKSSTHCVKDRP